MNDPIDAAALLSRLQGMAREAGLSQAPGAANGARAAGSETPFAGPAPIERPRAVGAAEASPRVDFGAVIGDAVRGVDARADAARELTEGYERGRPDVDLAEVMIAAQKARVSFEALLQVRNRMVSAYRDVMNMPL